MTLHRFEDPRPPLERAAVQERTAELAADLARHAEQLGEQKTAEIAWMVVRRSRILALKLRAQALAGQFR